ncbi:MAG: fimbrillin family protein [Bacteroidaceae bacterium]|nr:fimbrillin family protein [Bacteroidaceae bacterium]
MKRINYYMSLAIGMLLFASCASEETRPSDWLNESGEYIEGNSTYEIRLRGQETATITRAAIIGDESTAILENMGIFALARAKQGTNPAAYDIQWFNAPNANITYCIMDNVEARMESGDISWTGKYFYPITQFYNYDFYGYYPYTDDIDRNDNDVVAHYTIDGTQDLIWGRATSNEDYAYSAKYYRKYPENHPGLLAPDPVLELKHLLTRLTFTVQPGESYHQSGDYSQAEAMKVKSIEIVDAYTNLDIRVADRENIDEADWSDPDHVLRVTLRDDTKADLALKNPDGTALTLTQVPLHTDPALQVGESFMLFPATSYVIKIVLLDENDVEHISEIPLTLTFDEQNPIMFARGKSYTVNITVHGPREISLKGQLEDWEDLPGPALEL